MMKWKNIRDECPFSGNQGIITITKLGSVDFCLARALNNSVVSLFTSEVWSWTDYKQQIKCWCYLKDLMETIPEGIFDEKN